MDREEFERLVTEAVNEIPETFQRYLSNIEIVVEDEPSISQLRSLGLNPSRDTLFGLYHGIPLNQRSAYHGNTLPDRITIFYLPLIRNCRGVATIREQIRRTVVHEIGHFFGLDEDEIRREGY